MPASAGQPAEMSDQGVISRVACQLTQGHFQTVFQIPNPQRQEDRRRLKDFRDSSAACHSHGRLGAPGHAARVRPAGGGNELLDPVRMRLRALLGWIRARARVALQLAIR
jgi:hypothetical protein